jgi:hypothetical protein
MAEAELGHDLLQIGIHGVLVELGLAQLRDEGRGGKREIVLGQLDVAGDQALGLEAHVELLAHGPVLARAQLQLAIRHPLPGAIELGSDGDTLFHHCAHRLERRHRGREFHPQRPRRGFLADGSQPRFVDVDSHGCWLGARLPPVPAVAAASAGSGQGDEEAHRLDLVRPGPVAAAPGLPATPTQPGWRRPLAKGCCQGADKYCKQTSHEEPPARSLVPEGEGGGCFSDSRVYCPP